MTITLYMADSIWFVGRVEVVSLVNHWRWWTRADRGYGAMRGAIPGASTRGVL